MSGGCSFIALVRAADYVSSRMCGITLPRYSHGHPHHQPTNGLMHLFSISSQLHNVAVKEGKSQRSMRTSVSRWLCSAQQGMAVAGVSYWPRWSLCGQAPCATPEVSQRTCALASLMTAATMLVPRQHGTRRLASACIHNLSLTGLHYQDLPSEWHQVRHNSHGRR